MSSRLTPAPRTGWRNSAASGKNGSRSVSRELKARSIRSPCAMGNLRNSTSGDGSASIASPTSWCHSVAKSTEPWRRVLPSLRMVNSDSLKRERTASRANYSLFAPSSVQRRRVEFVLDALVVIEPRKLTVKLGAFLFRKLGLHVVDLFGELRMVELFQRGRNVGENREAPGGDFRKAAKHDDLLLRGSGDDRQDTRANRRHHRRVSGQDAEITFEARNIDLIDLA